MVDMKRRDEMARTTNVSFQPEIKLIKTPIKNVDVNCKALPSLSPIPSFILFTSLF